MACKDLYEHRAAQLRETNDARKRRFALPPVVEEDGARGEQAAAPALAGREWPLLFRPPSPPGLPPEPHPVQRGAPVRLLSRSREALGGLEAGLQASMWGAGGAGGAGGEDVVLSVLGGSGGVKENAEADGELARNGHWYHYPPNDYGARRPRRLQNIRALSVSGDATAVDFGSVASCLLAKPPQLIPRPKGHVDAFGERHVRLQAEGMSAVDVVKQGPGYGPAVLAVHDAVVDGAIIEALAKMLESNPLSDGMCTIDTLIFSNNSLNSVKQKFLEPLFRSFRNNYRLAVLRFSFNQIANHTASHIFSAAAGCYALNTLNLSDNIIGDSGLETAARLLSEAAHLTTLNLENNRISDIGVRHICYGLVCNQSIRELNLNRNRLRDQSLHYLCASLVENDKEALMRALDIDPDVNYKSMWKANRTLETLRVSHNYLANAAAQRVARIFSENLAVTTFDLSTNQIGEPGARAMAQGLLHRSRQRLSNPDEDETAGPGALQVGLSRNRFGDAGVNAIRDAVKATGNVHNFRMEGVRPGFGLVEDAAREPLEPIEPEIDFLDVRSRPATQRRSNRSSRLPTRASTPPRGIHAPATQRKSGSRLSEKPGVGTPRPRTVRILESPLPLYIDTLHPSGSQTDRPPDTGSDALLPDIPRPRTVRFVEPEDAPSPDAREPTGKSSRGGSKLDVLRTPERVRLRTAERASFREALRGSRGGREGREGSVGGYRSGSGPFRTTGAASGLLQNEPSFVAACARLEIPADFSKPPKTGGGRRKQQRIYERYLTYHKRNYPEVSARLPQMMHNLARLAGGALDGKDVQGAGDVGAPQERRPARKLGRGQGEGHVGSGAGGGKNKILFASSEGGNQQALDRDLPVAVGDSSHADGSVLRSRHDA